jgi:hypothetical protein
MPMSTPIRILIGAVALEATLSETPCARAIAGLLPLRAPVSAWGDEFYFAVPVAMGPDATSTTEVDAGDIGYWPPGSAFTIFFGPTPLSTDDRPVPASAVNRVGKVNGDARLLRKAKGAVEIRIDRA